jgi:hypothetical protein
MDKNRSGSGENFVQKDDFEVQQEALWGWAAERVPPWGKMQKDDYDFRSWIKKGERREELLSAGCLYEYARESHKFSLSARVEQPKARGTYRRDDVHRI